MVLSKLENSDVHFSYLSRVNVNKIYSLSCSPSDFLKKIMECFQNNLYGINKNVKVYTSINTKIGNTFLGKLSETTLVYGTRTLYTPLSDFNSICKAFNFSIKRIWKYIIMCWNFAVLVTLVSLNLQRILGFHHTEHI